MSVYDKYLCQCFSQVSFYMEYLVIKVVVTMWKYFFVDCIPGFSLRNLI